ncbi:hypothetical protein, partial [uncultured Sunxiuqinia sp.]|uniref:hypothetical protein n=1 Tax=uncultured Sunxiuqinia sp. TaxID=1573825 RepID=UPI0030DDC3EF
RELSISKKALTWAVAEDALAFLTDAGLVGRQTIPQQARSTAKQYRHRIGAQTSRVYLVASCFSRSNGY